MSQWNEPQDVQDFLALPGVRAYVDKLWARLAEVAERASTLPSGSVAALDWNVGLGKLLWNSRKARGVSRQQVAGHMALDANEIRLVEVGLGTPDQMSVAWVSRYAEAIGDPNLVEDVRAKLY